MPTTQQILNTSNALSNLLSAEQQLIAVSNNTGDPAVSAAISVQINMLNTIVQALVQAKVQTDDALFGQATANLKAQAQQLKTVEANIKTIVKDVGIAAQILGFLVQAATFVAAL